MVMGHDDPRPAASPGAMQFEPPRGSASVHLDALRGLAALSVMYSHWWDAFYTSFEALPSGRPLLVIADYYARFGHAWVIVFFVLSGYLVGGSVLRALRDCKWSWSSYLLVRCTRIYVVLVPALVLGGLLDWLGMHQSGAETLYAGDSGMGSLYYSAYATLTPTAFLQSLIFLGLGSPGFGSNGPLWSLGHEFWYYMAFPFLVFALYPGQRRAVRLGAVLALIAWAAVVGGYKVALFPVWLTGVVILFLSAMPRRPPWNRRWSHGVALGLSALLLLAGFILKSRGLLFRDDSLTIGRSHWHPPISDLVLSPIVGLAVWVILNYCTSALPTAYVWIARKAADSSYTLYLVHFPALVFLKAFLHLPRLAPSWHTLPSRLALFLLVIVYAQGVYWLFERNTDTVRRWLKRFIVRQRRFTRMSRALKSGL